MVMLSESGCCMLCRKVCQTDKLGYRQGMVTVWKYGAFEVNYSLICSSCRNKITKFIKSLKT